MQVVITEPKLTVRISKPLAVAGEVPVEVNRAVPAPLEHLWNKINSLTCDGLKLSEQNQLIITNLFSILKQGSRPYEYLNFILNLLFINAQDS